MSFWTSDEWYAYEKAYGDEPGTRANLLSKATWCTQTVDLAPAEVSLWADLRKSYKSLIRQAERRVTFAPADAHRVEATCRALHEREAGRQTRDAETWRLMAQWIPAQAFALMAWDGAPLGYVYFVIWDDWAYYFSAASREPDLNHGLIWHAMLALKARGVHWCELGWQGHADPTDAKGIGIEFFRRGFGGQTIPLREYYGGSVTQAAARAGRAASTIP